MTRAYVWLCLVLGLLVLRGDHAQQLAARFKLVYVGKGSAQEDPGYARLQRELRMRHPTLMSQLTMAFALDSLDDAELAETLRHVALQKPDIVFTPNGRGAAAVRRAAPALPLVFGTFADPVRFGVVSSLERRTEPVTGVWIADDLDGKRLEILHDAYPHVRRVAILGDRDWGRNVHAEEKLPTIAARLGLELTILYAQSPEEGLSIASAPESARFDAWCLPRTGASLGHTPTFVRHFIAQHQAVILADTSEVRTGAPLSYALDPGFAWPAMADLVARVLDGEPASSIPIERPPRFVLAVHAGASTAGMHVHPQVMRRADVIVR